MEEGSFRECRCGAKSRSLSLFCSVTQGQSESLALKSMSLCSSVGPRGGGQDDRGSKPACARAGMEGETRHSFVEGTVSGTLWGGGLSQS